jgi:hypothetical protein
MPLKPTKFGYKVRVRGNAKTGYVFQFQVYTGNEEDVTEFGLGGRVVKNLSYKKHECTYISRSIISLRRQNY